MRGSIYGTSENSDEPRAAIVLFASARRTATVFVRWSAIAPVGWRSPDRGPSPLGPPLGGQRARAVDGPRCEGGSSACRRWRTQASGKKTPAVIDAIHKLMEREAAGATLSVG